MNGVGTSSRGQHHFPFPCWRVAGAIVYTTILWGTNPKFDFLSEERNSLVEMYKLLLA